MEWFYVIVLIAIVMGLILWVNYLNKLQEKLQLKRKLKNKFYKMGVPKMNNDEDVGAEQVESLQCDAKILPAPPGFGEVNNALLILITKLQCANLIIPDVEFQKDDSVELMQLKKEIMKVKNLLGELVNG